MWLPYGLFIKTMSLFKNLPSVYSLRAKTLLSEIREAGFRDIERHDLGLKATSAFVMARKV